MSAAAGYLIVVAMPPPLIDRPGAAFVVLGLMFAAFIAMALLAANPRSPA